jgi:exonuclease SbcD
MTMEDVMSKAPDFAGIVTGDWHLDRFNRIEDFARCVDFVLTASVAKKKALDDTYGPDEVPFVFNHTGDGYKTWHPAPVEMNVMHRTKLLQDYGIQGRIVVGNHDWPESEDHGGMHCFTEMKTLGGALQVIDEPTIIPVTSKNILIANYIYIPHIPKAKLQRAGLSYRDYFKRAMNELIARCPDGSRIILFTHCYIKEAAVGTSDLVVESDRQISVEDLKDPRLMAVFLGDIHKAQKLADKPMVLYPGSIDRIDFGEANDAKGIAYYEVWGNEIKVEFIPTPARKFVHIVANLVQDQTAGENRFFDVPDVPSEIQPWLERKLADYDLKDTIVKITIRCGPSQKDQIDDRKLSDLLVGMGANRVRSVNYDVVTAKMNRAPEITEALSPVAALGKWIDMQEYAPITKQSVFLAGKKLIGAEQ